MWTRATWMVGLIAIAAVAGCSGDDAAPTQGTGTTATVSPPAAIVGAGAGGAAATNAGSAATGTAGGLSTPMTPVGTVPVAGGNPMAGSSAQAGMDGTMMAGLGGMGGRGGMAGRGGSGAPLAGSGMAGAGTAGSGTAGSTPPGDCTENLACKLAVLPSSGDVRQDCVDRINQFRTQCACLPALARWTEAEACADMMAEYDSTQPTAHAGFRARICMPGGSGQNECPRWRSETQVVDRCLQSMWDEGPPPMEPCEGDCFQTHGHFINMSSTRSTKVACGFFTTSSGQIWAVQNFSR